nr:uncharacterized protein LOC109413948 [Aedes albopictus]
MHERRLASFTNGGNAGKPTIPKSSSTGRHGSSHLTEKRQRSSTRKGLLQQRAFCLQPKACVTRIHGQGRRIIDIGNTRWSVAGIAERKGGTRLRHEVALSSATSFRRVIPAIAATSVQLVSTTSCDIPPRVTKREATKCNCGVSDGASRDKRRSRCILVKEVRHLS